VDRVARLVHFFDPLRNEETFDPSRAIGLPRPACRASRIDWRELMASKPSAILFI
jgi:hypothetical protein